MSTKRLFDDINDRVHLARESGDLGYFYALTARLEYVTKLVTSAVIACIGDDTDRQRYSLEYDLVRADSLGSWVKCLQIALVGQPARLVRSGAQDLISDLTQRASRGDWRKEAVASINQAAVSIGARSADLGSKPALRQFFDIAVTLRNRGPGHGHPTHEQCSVAAEHLEDACNALATNLRLFRIPWVYLRRNWSGKYRVTALLNDGSPFDYLKRTKAVAMPNGVYLFVDQPVHIPLIYSDAEISDIALPNGAYNKQSFETLSYITNETPRQDGSPWCDDVRRPPASETEGRGELDVVGNAFTNIPEMSPHYVRRQEYEAEIETELLTSDRHPIVSLTGPGGIGKTTIAIAAISEILEAKASPYRVVLWISARDVDLLDWGPKPVSPNAVTQRDIARVASNLLGSATPGGGGTDPVRSFERCLTEGAAGCTLFVFDNFETVENPSELYRWIDLHIRPPNKALITTRMRDFVGDYHIEITGMNDEEAKRLIDSHAERLNVRQLLGDKYIREVLRESGGHPYVIKILLGEMAKVGRPVKPQRVVASNRDLLRALFERTYNTLSPGAQRVFLLLSSWRVSVPDVGLEAVLLRPGSIRFDVEGALEELERYSLVDREFGTDGEGFVTVSLAAAEYGKRKLDVSPYKVATEHDVKLLREFGIGGMGTKADARVGVFPRIENLFEAIEGRVSRSVEAFEEELPVLEFLASRVPKAYPRLARMVVDKGDGTAAVQTAKEYMRRFLENAQGADRVSAWLSLADLCQMDEDVLGEIQALCEAALLVIQDERTLGSLINRLNGRIKRLKDDGVEAVRSGGVRELIERVCDRLWSVRDSLSATNASRFAWLCLNVGRTEAAIEVTSLGLRKEPRNVYCVKLGKKFGL